LPLPFWRVVCQLSECFRLRYANPDSQVRTLQNRSADLFAELRQVPAVANTSQVAKSLVNAVNFDAGAHFLKRCHHPVGHISIELVITAEANNASAPE
jgi:hypothetical protein